MITPVDRSPVLYHELSTSEDDRLLGHTVENQSDILEYGLICIVVSVR